jgi:sugar lactone lactonase YvrE
MLQPNDLALSAQRDILIFLSGQNFTGDTTAGVSGDLWTCDGGLTIQIPPSILAAAGIHRTNGIEADPTGNYLYVSSAKDGNLTVVENAIFKFKLDPNTGYPVEKAPVLFFNFLDTAATDIDGMRADTEGNLFVTRNGLGQVVKLSPEGQLLEVIEFPNMGGPSNLEFGGPKGSTLFAIGKCINNATIGCAASFVSDSVGRAFQTLQKDW